MKNNKIQNNYTNGPLKITSYTVFPMQCLFLTSLLLYSCMFLFCYHLITLHHIIILQVHHIKKQFHNNLGAIIYFVIKLTYCFFNSNLLMVPKSFTQCILLNVV